ncbi:MAG: DNA topoisomerase IV [Bacteroidetes bacterium CG2_30_33_31]|nr:MAG: DNA topoisomerase IV [Bacteroidetes bacterium CG2_30_33_31]
MNEETEDNLEEMVSENLNGDVNGIDSTSRIIGLSGLYKDWFLDYASYVILERAVPNLRDGLKPVQRRIMHSMKEMDDGRYNKVANIIGNTMKYHPHGDASIGEALVQLGQKDLLIDMQGNWGNPVTGDSAAAPRYIEARLSKFAIDVVFNAKTTNWLLSYDGRNKEPETLPIKFPLLLAQGVEGIAVGLASKILPHNFIELIDASISYLKGNSFELYPDFITGGMADVSKYNNGLRGGRVRVRAKISKIDKKILIITEIPFGTTTGSVIDSIIQANDKGKIKIKKIEDNTAENVEIKIVLGQGVSPDQTIDALYAFTICESSVSPNSCVIDENKPHFLGVKKLLKISTDHTVALLKLELEIRREELLESWHFANLEKIFIKERIYREIEEAESWDEALELIDKGLNPYKHLFKREITRDDISKLTEIKIKRISKYNEFKADEHIKEIEDELKDVDFHLEHLVDFAIDYFKEIKKKYGPGRERKTELRNFENIDAASVAVSNERLYINREEGFIGTGLKKDEFLFECSDIDDIIAFRDNGTFVVTKLADKIFIGKGIIHVGVFNKNEDRTIYNIIYRDGKVGSSFAKRFSVTSITRDKIYHITKGKPESFIHYFSANPNGEAEIVKVKLKQRAKVRKLIFDFDFSELAIKGRSAGGNTLTKYLVHQISLKEDGVSTLGAREIWFDDSVHRLNVDQRGIKLGKFHAEDKILTIMANGDCLLNSFDLSTHFDENMIHILKYNPDDIWTLVYFEGVSEYYYLKRFLIEKTDKKVSLLSDHPKSRFINISRAENIKVELIFDKTDKQKPINPEILDVEEFIDVKGFKAKGKRLSANKIKKINIIEPEIDLEEDETFEEEIQNISEVNESDSIENFSVSNTDNYDDTEIEVKAQNELIDNQYEGEHIVERDIEIAEPKIIAKNEFPIIKPEIDKEKVVEKTTNKTNIALEPEETTDLSNFVKSEIFEAEKKLKSKTEKKTKSKPELKSELVGNKKIAAALNPKKPASSVKKKADIVKTDPKKVSLNSDEPLQMELDF